MKKLFLFMVSLFMIQGIATAMEKKISMDKLPKAAQTFIMKNLTTDNVTSIMMEDDMDYRVMWKDGTKVEFDKMGMWKDIEAGKGGSVPMSVVPKEIQTVLMASHKGAMVQKIEKESSGGYELKLSDGKELKFNSMFKQIWD